MNISRCKIQLFISMMGCVIIELKSAANLHRTILYLLVFCIKAKDWMNFCQRIRLIVIVGEVVNSIFLVLGTERTNFIGGYSNISVTTD